MDPAIPPEDLAAFQSNYWLTTTAEILSRDEPVDLFPPRAPALYQTRGWPYDDDKSHQPEQWLQIGGATAFNAEHGSGGCYRILQLCAAAPPEEPQHDAGMLSQPAAEMRLRIGGATTFSADHGSGGCYRILQPWAAPLREDVEPQHVAGMLRRFSGACTSGLVEEESSISADIFPLCRPIPISDFINRFRGAADTTAFIHCAEEFNLLRDVGAGKPCNIAGSGENAPKNRFTEVLPYDDVSARVILVNAGPPGDQNDGEQSCGTDTIYINASYIRGFNSEKEYIATQSPLKTSSGRIDFWRMIWEQKARAVVNLASRDELGSECCDLYWPVDKDEDGNITMGCGDFHIMLLDPHEVKEKEGCWTLRQLAVMMLTDFKMGGRLDTRRTIQVWHYAGWRHGDIAEHPQVLLAFVAAIIKHTPRSETLQDGTILVHSTADIGRTGCYIAMDRIFRQLLRASKERKKFLADPANANVKRPRIPLGEQFAKTGFNASHSGGSLTANPGDILNETVGDNITIDVFGIVSDMRQRRRNMVQNVKQYWFIHKFIAMLLENQCFAYKPPVGEHEIGEPVPPAGGGMPFLRYAELQRFKLPDTPMI